MVCDDRPVPRAGPASLSPAAAHCRPTSRPARRGYIRRACRPRRAAPRRVDPCPRHERPSFPSVRARPVRAGPSPRATRAYLAPHPVTGLSRRSGRSTGSRFMLHSCFSSVESHRRATSSANDRSVDRAGSHPGSARRTASRASWCKSSRSYPSSQKSRQTRRITGSTWASSVTVTSVPTPRQPERERPRRRPVPPRDVPDDPPHLRAPRHKASRPRHAAGHGFACGIPQLFAPAYEQSCRDG